MNLSDTLSLRELLVKEKYLLDGPDSDLQAVRREIVARKQQQMDHTFTNQKTLILIGHNRLHQIKMGVVTEEDPETVRERL